jgi:hypothetical protein
LSFIIAQWVASFFVLPRPQRAPRCERTQEYGRVGDLPVPHIDYEGIV